MNKKDTYFCLAERMYVEEQKTACEIAQNLNLTEKTIGVWKKNGNWDDKRRKFLNSQFACYSGLYELLNKVTEKVVEDFKETGEIPERSTMNFISKMIDKLPKLKNLEALEIAEKLEKETGENKNINKDILLNVDKFLRGEF